MVLLRMRLRVTNKTSPTGDSCDSGSLGVPRVIRGSLAFSGTPPLNQLIVGDGMPVAVHSNVTGLNSFTV